MVSSSVSRASFAAAQYVSLCGCERRLGISHGTLAKDRPGGTFRRAEVLCANAAINEHEVLITYDGPIIDHPTRYSIQIDDGKHIEGTPESNAYLNHSCAPNAYVDWNGVCLRALRPISRAEEITCNSDYRLGAA